MKGKFALIISLLITVVFFVCAGVFFSHDMGKVEAIFNKTVTALDSEKGLADVFTPAAVENTKNLSREIDKINEFYVGKSVEVMNFTMYRESSNIYRMYATVRTDGGEYFVCIAGSGARMIDTYGIDQLIIEDSQDFQHKNLFKKKEFNKYLEHAKEFGITIRTKGDR